MQISKTLLMLLVVALCVGRVAQAEPDSEAQAKAREALRKKMADGAVQPVAEAPAGNPHATPDQTERLRNTVRQKIVELGELDPVTGLEFRNPTMRSDAAGNSPATSERSERLRESVRQKIVELNEHDKAIAAAPAVKAPASPPEQPVVASQPKPTVSQPKPPKVRPTPTGFDPIPAPPTSLSPAKEARLAELLKQYQADTLTPEQYHKERAKILAEP